MAVDFDKNALLDLVEKGYQTRDIANFLDISPTTVRARIAKLQEEQPVLLQYREMHNLHLTKLQMKILDSITEEDIERASLAEKVTAYKILKGAEMAELGKPSQITGVVGYLLKIEQEKEEMLKRSIPAMNSSNNQSLPAFPDFPND